MTPPGPEDEGELEYTHASLIVNLSTDSPSSIDFRQQKIRGSGEPSFLLYSPLSSSRSAPPDLTFSGDADSANASANDNDGLPRTVTKLTPHGHGTNVYVIGTTHFSLESQNDVVKTIQQVQPSLVVLELCPATYQHILTYDEETILREASNLYLEKIRYTIQKSGAVQGALHLLLLSMSFYLTKKPGMAPGGEFHVAYQQAQALPHHCPTIFGDRLFTITLARALASLSFGQKLYLGWQFLTSNSNDITKEEIERCKEKDIFEQMLEEMTGEYPSISNVFVGERDVYLAHSLWLTANDGRHDGDIAGVVGMGHVPGIVRLWGTTTESDMNEITEMPKPTLSSIFIRKSFKVGFYCLIGYGIYKVGLKVVHRLPALPPFPLFHYHYQHH